MNYDLKFDLGEFYQGMPAVRAKAVTDKGAELQGSKRGYGTNEQEAVADFIRKNTQTIIEKVFS